MAVGKGNERRREMTERISFADCQKQSAKAFLIFFIIEFLCRLLFLAGGKGLFADCLFWQVAKGSLPTAFFGQVAKLE
jgi:hypothetical protein